jgi:hypothetical protein
MITQEELCKQIRMIYPDIGECGIDLNADYDGEMLRWAVTLKKDGRVLKTYLEPGDVEYCLLGKECLSLAIEINQLKDSIERMPGTSPESNGGGDSLASQADVCQKAPELAEHYRMGDDDLPCDDGRSGDRLKG